eukprot:m51a1_g8769 putative rRNA processing protein RRP1 (349) ;mRNA; f:155331-156506
MDLSVLDKFALSLASPDKKIRDRSVLALERYLSGQAEGMMSDLDMEKLWRGLYYAMWHSDKPLVQQDLARRIARLARALPSRADACRFARAFFALMARDWESVDEHRLDKFLSLVRRVVEELPRACHDAAWDPRVVAAGAQALAVAVRPARGDDEPEPPAGLAMHVLYCLWPSFDAVAAELEAQVPAEATAAFAAPVVDYLAHGTQRTTMKRAVDVGLLLLAHRDTLPRVDRDRAALAAALFERASAKQGLREDNRAALFEAHRAFEADAAVEDRQLARKRMVGAQLSQTVGAMADALEQRLRRRRQEAEDFGRNRKARRRALLKKRAAKAGKTAPRPVLKMTENKSS